MEARSSGRSPRFWIALQPSIVRAYKVAGMIALTAILIGLIGFLTVNVFYFFDRSWVRPVVIDAAHEKVVELSRQLADARQREHELATERLEVEAKLQALGLELAADERFLAEVGTQADAPRAAEQWLLRREVDRARRALATAAARRAALDHRLATIKLRVEEQARIVKRLQQSPYHKALDHAVVLAFVPYKNLRATVREGSPLYACAWGLVRCSAVGKVTAILDGEVTGSHHHDGSVQRGQLVEIEVSAAAAGDTVLFAGARPLWLL